MRAQPAWVDVVLRTVFYALGVAAVLVLEKGVENMHEYGGFRQAVEHQFHKTDTYHVWANTLCLSGALLGYNLISVVQRHVGAGGLAQMFLSPLPNDPIDNDKEGTA